MDSQLNAIEQASNVLNPVVAMPSILVTSSNCSPIRSPELLVVPSHTDYRRRSPRFDVLPVEDRRGAELQLGRSGSSSNGDDERFVRPPPPPPPSTPLRTPANGAGANNKAQRKGRLAAIASAFKTSIRRTPKTLCVSLMRSFVFKYFSHDFIILYEYIHFSVYE